MVELSWHQIYYLYHFSFRFVFNIIIFLNLQIIHKLSHKWHYFLSIPVSIIIYSGDSRFEASAQMLPPEKERNMLAVLTQLEDQGRREGRREGTDNLNRVYANLLMQGRNEDLTRSINDPEYLKKIMAEFGFSDDEDEDEKTDE